MVPDEHLTHECFEQPKRRESRVWRYMDVAKLVSLLQTRSLYLSRIDRLHDPYEGRIGRHVHDTLAAAVVMDPRLQIFIDSIPDTEKFVRCYFVNCWCLQEHESDALWRIYGGLQNAGIAIRSTYGELVRQLPSTDFIGLVKYLDYGAVGFSLGNVLNQVMHKRTQFSYENEVRIVRAPSEFIIDRESHRVNLENVPLGVPCEIDPNKLIEAIVTSPYMDDWLVEVIRRLVEKYELIVPVEISSMKQDVAALRPGPEGG